MRTALDSLALHSRTETYSAVVGNPPYQTEVARETRGDQKTVMNVFHRHQMNALGLASQTCLIYPGERWINKSGKGLRDFGLFMTNSSALSRVVFWPHSQEVFSEVKLGDGVSVVHWNSNSTEDNWVLDYRNSSRSLHDEVTLPLLGDRPLVMDPRVQKIVSKTLAHADTVGLIRLSRRTTPQKTFSIESNFVQLNPHAVQHEAPSDEDLPHYCRIFTNAVGGKAGRAEWFWIKRSAIRTNAHYIDKYKIIVSSMNPVGARGTGHSPLAQILKPGEIFGRARIGLGVFDSEEEAQNFYRYVQTDFVRFHYACLGDSQTLLGANAPDPGGFTRDTMDFSGTVEDLNRRLCAAYGLTETEQNFISDWVGDLAPFSKQ